MIHKVLDAPRACNNVIMIPSKCGEERKKETSPTDARGRGIEMGVITIGSGIIVLL